MRVKLSKASLKKLFNAVLEKHKSWKNAAITSGVSTRTLRDWRQGKYSIPFMVFKRFRVASGLHEDELSPIFLSDFWHINDAAKKGALVRMRLHGNFGTPEGRKRGGFASLITHAKKQTDFKVLKNINEPRYSQKFAEFMGILFGDGHVSKYQVSITTNSKTDKAHALFIKELIKDLFGISAKLKYYANENTVVVVASSKALAEFLNRHGMPVGNKLQKGLSIPIWILSNALYQKAFIRGLFDTDGCIYVDVHKINKKIYKHFGLAITSYAEELLNDVIKMLQSLGFSPTHRTSQKSLFIRKQDEIVRFFQEIGTNNPKHYKRYLNGGIPKRP